MNKFVPTLTALVAAPAAFAASSLVNLDFGGNPVANFPAASGADVTGNNWNAVGTAGGNIVEFNDGSFDVASFGTINVTTGYSGTAGNDWKGGIGTQNNMGIGLWRDNGGAPQGTEAGQWGTTPGVNEIGLTVSLDQPVLLESVQAAWWDGGADKPGTWQLTINGETNSPLPADEGSVVNLGGIGFTTTTIDGVTGVLLPAGSQILLEDDNVITTNTNGDPAMDNGLLRQVNFYVVPEPAVPVLIGLTGIALIFRRRSR